MPAPSSLLREINVPTVNPDGVSMDEVGECCAGLESFYQRAKPPSAGGDKRFFSSRRSSAVRPRPWNPSSAMCQRQAHAARVVSGTV